jgi:hypothetical protein
MCVSSRRSECLVAASAVVLAAALISGFGLAATAAQPGSSEPLVVPVAYYGETSEKSSPDRQPRDLAFVLGAIPGAIGGSAKQAFAKLDIGRQESVRLNLDELSARAKRQAAELDESTSSWLQITPQDARFARVATLVWFSTRQPVQEAIGFVDSETGNTLTLLYFDRPCRLTGNHVFPATASRGAMMVDYDLKVESAGFVWMETKLDGPVHRSNSLAVSPHPVLVIAPPESMAWPGNRRAAAAGER